MRKFKPSQQIILTDELRENLDKHKFKYDLIHKDGHEIIDLFHVTILGALWFTSATGLILIEVGDTRLELIENESKDMSTKIMNRFPFFIKDEKYPPPEQLIEFENCKTNIDKFYQLIPKNNQNSYHHAKVLIISIYDDVVLFTLNIRDNVSFICKGILHESDTENIVQSISKYLYEIRSNLALHYIQLNSDLNIDIKTRLWEVLPEQLMCNINSPYIGKPVTMSNGFLDIGKPVKILTNLIHYLSIDGDEILMEVYYLNQDINDDVKQNVRLNHKHKNFNSKFSSPYRY